MLFEKLSKAMVDLSAGSDKSRPRQAHHRLHDASKQACSGKGQCETVDVFRRRLLLGSEKKHPPAHVG